VILYLCHTILLLQDNPESYWYFEDIDCEQYALDLVQVYLLFMTLRRDTHPRFILQPPPIIDEAWHAHILNTRNYKEFCMREFGYFVHHTPGDGTRSFYMANYRNVLQSYAEKKISYPADTGTLTWKLIEHFEFFPSIRRMYDFLEHGDDSEETIRPAAADYDSGCG